MEKDRKGQKLREDNRVNLQEQLKRQDVRPREEQIYSEDRSAYSKTVDELSGDMMKLEVFREETLEWLLEVTQQLHLKSITTESAIILFDRLLLTPTWEVDPNQAEVDVLTVVFISIKLYEEYFMTAFDMLDILDVGIRADRIVEREVEIMFKLEHKMMSVLPSEHFYSKYHANVKSIVTQPPTTFLFNVLCRTELRKYRLTMIMEALHLWCKLD